MGTQQVLLIVLSVIIVGVAIAVGISMFTRFGYNSNKTAIGADTQNFAMQVVQYYKTPSSQGGSSYVMDPEDKAALYVYLGWPGGFTSNENGLYAVTDITSIKVEITGYGKAKRGTMHPSIVTTINFPDGEITAASGNDGAATGPTPF